MIVHARYPGASGNSRSGVALMARRRNWSPVLFRNQAGAQAPLFGGGMMALYFADGYLAAHPLRTRRVARPASLVGRSPRGIRGLFDQTQRQRDADTGAAAGRTSAAGCVWHAARTWGGSRSSRLF